MVRKICRVCGRSAGYKRSLKLFSNQTILSNIQMLTGLVLENADLLPDLICILCQTQLREAIRFRKRVIEAQNDLLLGLSEEQLQEIPIQCRESLKTVVIDSNLISKSSDAESNPEIASALELTNEEIRSSGDNKADIINKASYEGDEDLMDNDLIVDASIIKQEADSEPIEAYYIVEYVDEPQFEIAKEVTEDVETKDFILPNHETDENEVLNKVLNHDNTLTQSAVKKNQNPNRTIYTCDECGSRIAGRTDFEIHCKRHRGDKQFGCTECQVRFCTNQERMRHLRTHSGERPYACRLCGRFFGYHEARNRHERCHSNERPYVCGTCGKGYTSNQILRNHMLIHSGILPHRCDVCDKSFRLSYNLKLHLRTILHKIELEKYELKQQKQQEQALEETMDIVD